MTAVLAVLAVLACCAGASAAPPAAAVGMQDFIGALIAAARPLNGEQSADFLSPGRDPAERPTLVGELEQVKEYWTDGDLSLELAQGSPQAFTLGGTMNSKRGGMIVWRNDVFAADFFVRRFGSDGGALKAVLRQPWFSWGDGSLTYHATGAGARIFTLLRAAAGDASALSLFRGTTSYEAQVLELSRKLAAGEPLDAGWRGQFRANLQELAAHAEEFYRAYEKGLTEGWSTEADVAAKRLKWQAVTAANEDLLRGAEAARDERAVRDFLRGAMASLLTQGDFCGLFTTPDVERARLFSKGQVVEFSFMWEELAELMARGALYVGFEKMQSGEDEDVKPEVAFLGPSAAQEASRLADAVLRAFRGSTAVEPSTLFN